MAFRWSYFLFASISVVAALVLNSYFHDARFGASPVELRIGSTKVLFTRDSENGHVPHLLSMSDHPEIDFARGLGFLHANDRHTQMVMQKLSGLGRLSEAFGTEHLRDVDEFLHTVGFMDFLDESIETLAPSTREYLEAYAEGVNFARDQRKKLLPDVQGMSKWTLLRKVIRTVIPSQFHQPIGDFLGSNWEFFLAGYDDSDPWTIRDSLVIFKLLGYVGLADTQILTEKVIYRAIHAGIPVEKLQLAFPNLNGITDEIVELIKKMDISNLDTLPMPPLEFVPHFSASNNWVISGSNTASGKPFQCNDPHLLINRLPSVWYEVVFRAGKKYWMGISLPGIPGIVMGRNNDVSFGLTYGFLDQIDLWMEEVKDGKYRSKDGSFVPLETRDVVIQHKDSDQPTTLVFYSTDNGRLLRKSNKKEIGPPKDGIYMSERWVIETVKEENLGAFFPLPSPKSVAEFKKLLKNVVTPCNFLLADSAGNIGYQQGGIFPIRSGNWTGFFPGVGWKEEYAWKGVSQPDDLVSIDNPPKGYLATANNYIESLEHPHAINLHMGSSRKDRAEAMIASILETRKVTKDDMKRMHADVFSTQADRFIDRLQEFVGKHEALANSKIVNRLLAWDRTFGTQSKEASLFDSLYLEMTKRVFGHVFGDDAWNNLRFKTGLLEAFHPYYDSVLLNDDALSAFCPKYRSLEQLMVEVITDLALSKDLDKDVPEWGKMHDVTLINIFFRGELPKVLAADLGPFPYPGTRDTLNQAGRSPKTFDTTERHDVFAPSWRYVADLSETFAETCLPGGVTGNLFSSLYDNFVTDYLGYKYHKLRAF